MNSRRLVNSDLGRNSHDYEAFWVIESGADRFIAHFRVADGQPLLFWIDRVGNLQTLKP